MKVRGDDVVSHAGSVITRILADTTGLTGELSDALWRSEVVHDRGAVMRDLAVSIADGATSMSDIAVLGDATLITSYSDKERAAGNFKGGYGFHPLTAWCDNTGELLAILPVPAAPARTRPPITSRSSTPRSPRSPRSTDGGALQDRHFR